MGKESFMKTLVFSVYDKAVGAFMPPFQSRSKGEAVRSFMTAVTKEGHQFNSHAGDYELFHIADFNDENGAYVPISPMRVISALECVHVREGEDK